MKIFLIVISGLFVIWILYSIVGSRVKEPPYTVLEEKDGYQIRRYESYIEARTIVSGEYNAAMSQGFRVLAGYIFGGNTSSTKLAMTVPVVEDTSQKIAMTAPVLEGEEGEEGDDRVVSFIMPAQYTLETLPVPDDQRVKIVQVPAFTAAVKRFSGVATASRMDKKKAELLEDLRRDDVQTIGTVRSARYNPPSTFPWLNRNEVIIDVEE